MDVIVDVTDIKIETDRLILRSWKEADLNDFYEYACVSGVGEMAGWPHHENIETTKKILNMFIEEKEVLALYHKNDNKVIGSLGLHYSWANQDERYNNLKVKEIGFVLSKDYWGQGLVPEAVNAVMHYFYLNKGIEAFTCGHFKENYQSRRVIEKCGFDFVKENVFFAKQLNKNIEDMEYIFICEQKYINT